MLYYAMKIIANNKKAYHDYYIEDTFEAGIELEGWEVKTARAAEVSLLESFVIIKDGSAYIKNAHFAPYKDGRVEEQNLRRDRRLLLHAAQIEKLSRGIKIKGYTVVTTKLYFNKSGLLKAEIALAKGKHNYDKKEVLKQKDIARDTERQLKKT